MKINEIETLLGLTRANIRFYEKEGLLTPTRNENGYREYDEEDVAILKKIIIFRKLGLSLSDIKKIFDGTLDISDALEENISNLNQQIAELNGALDVCKTIKNDYTKHTDFDEERYWNLIQKKEENGEKFADIVKDYLEMEKKSLLTMWSSVFFYDFNNEIKKYGWKIVFLIMLGICVVRGITQELFWPGGSFLEGFAYPFILFGTISLIIIPIFVLHQKYKDTEPEEEKPSKHPLFIGTLKWIGGLAYFIAYLFFIPGIAQDIFTSLHDHMTYVAAFDLFFLYWIIGMFVLAMFVYLYSKYGIFPNRITGEEGIKCNIPRKKKHIIALLSVIALFLSLLPSCTWYDCFTEEGLIISRIIYSKEYTWDEIDYYTLSASSSGTLTYSVIMQDGAKADCIGGEAMVWTSNLPEEKYPDSDYDFVKYLSRKFKEQGVELRVNDWNKLYKNLKYESWIELAEEIREIAE